MRGWDSCAHLGDGRGVRVAGECAGVDLVGSDGALIGDKGPEDDELEVVQHERRRRRQELGDSSAVLGNDDLQWQGAVGQCS